MNHDAIKSLPKGLIDDVAKFMRGERVAAVETLAEDEQLDEVSKKTLGSYIKKAVTDSHVKLASAHRFADASQISRDPEDKTKFAEKSAMKYTKHQNRVDGIKKAADKLTKEEVEDLDDLVAFNEDLEVGVFLSITEDAAEIMFGDSIVTLDTADIMFEDVEQLDELSKDTMKSYVKKAQADPAFEKKKGKPSKTTVAIRAKREKGMASAKEKLQAIVKAENEAHYKHAKKLHGKLDDHFEAEAPKILKKHGFDEVHAGVHKDPYGEGKDKHIRTFIHKHDNGHVSIMALHKELGDRNFSSSNHNARALNTKGASYSAHSAHFGVYDDKDHDAHMTTMMPKFEQHVIKVKEDGANSGNW